MIANSSKLSMVLGALVVIGAATWAPGAQASERVFVDVNLGHPYVVAPAPVVERQYVAGHYELRTETVVVEPEHRVREYVPQQTSSRTDARGYTYTVTSPGYYRDSVVPARLETRQVQVWVPEYYTDVAVPGPVVVHHRPVVSIGGFFRF